MNTRIAALCAAGFVTASTVFAEVVITSGIQTSSATASLGPTFGGPEWPGGPVSYSIAAPDQMATWSPPAQNANIAAGAASCTINSIYTSVVTPSVISLNSEAHTQQTAGETGIGAYRAVAEISQVFEVRFTLSSVTQATFEGFQQRGAFFSVPPSVVTFGQVSQTPLVNFVGGQGGDAGAPITYPLTAFTLQPGEYVVRATTTLDYSTGWPGSSYFFFDNKTRFTLTVPGPGTALVSMAGVVLAMRRRRVG